MTIPAGQLDEMVRANMERAASGHDHILNLRERDHILNTAKTLISSNRDKNYGDAATNFARIAELWKTILGVDITSEQVALCMAAVKIARLIQTPDHHDSWVDICGYAALGGEISTAAADASAMLRVG